MKIEDFIPELRKLQHEIDEAYRGIHFLWNRGFHEESDLYFKKWEELKRKRELILKPIFGL